MTFDLILRGGTLVTPAGEISADVGVQDGRIVEIGSLGDAETVLDVAGLHVLPGLIDTQVHFREPGLEHKEDLGTGTAGAALGGITAIFEMPNTNPNTDTAERLADKVRRGREKAWTDFAFFVGATAENAEHLGTLERLEGAAGVKIFMGSSTGTLLVDETEALRRVLQHGSRRIAVHCEDETRLKARKELTSVEDAHPRLHPVWRDEDTAILATKRLIGLAYETKRRVHVLHVTTEEEASILAGHKDLVTMEVTPQHLTLGMEDYERIGTFAQMNPPIRGGRHRDALWRAIQQGVVDVLGSDHAPHTREEKAKPYPKSPSGMPGVQTMVPLMLDAVNAGKMTLARLVDLLAHGPQRIYNIAAKGRLTVGYDADFTIVDLNAERTIEDSWIASRVGWTPFAGRTVRGWPVRTIIRGRTVMADDELVESPAGEPVRFAECL
ncbi:MAG: dihydroorotase [Myxococcota bacterium]